MKKIIVFIFLAFSSTLYACCCEAQIIVKTEAVKSHLNGLNKANEKAIEELNDKIKELNDEILINKVTEIKDSELKKELKKFKLDDSENLYHANNIPLGMIYYQLAKNNFNSKRNIDNVSNSRDILILKNKINLENLKQQIYKNTDKANSINSKEIENNK